MFELTTAIVVAVAFGLLLGVGPAVILAGLSGGLAHLDYAVPRVAVAIAALVLAGLNGYAVGVTDAAAFSSDDTIAISALSILVTCFVVVVLALYAHSLAKAAVDDLPFDVARPVRRERGLSAEATDAVDSTGWVAIRTAGAVRDIDGPPPLGPDLQTTLEEGTWRLPADLPLSALESRLEARLRTTHDLAAVSVSVDERGRATIAAAPPSNAVPSRIPDGCRTVTVWALLPTGLAPGDEVAVYPESETVAVVGRVVDVDATDEPTRETVAEDRSARSSRPAAVETPGGRGRVTVAVSTPDASVVLESDCVRIVALSGESPADVSAFDVLERAGQSVRSLPAGRLRTALASDAVDATLEDVRVLGGWTNENGGHSTETVARTDPTLVIEPDLSTLESDDDVFVIGDTATLWRIVDGDERTEPNATRSQSTVEKRAVEMRCG